MFVACIAQDGAGAFDPCMSLEALVGLSRTDVEFGVETTTPQERPKPHRALKASRLEEEISRCTGDYARDVARRVRGIATHP
jgi:hypothetical protein